MLVNGSPVKCPRRRPALRPEAGRRRERTQVQSLATGADEGMEADLKALLAEARSGAGGAGGDEALVRRALEDLRAGRLLARSRRLGLAPLVSVSSPDAQGGLTWVVTFASAAGNPPMNGRPGMKPIM